MKIGKQPKRLGGPSQAFLRKQAHSIGCELVEAPAAGPVQIFLDDERKAPEGWTVARTPAVFQTLIDDLDIADRVEMISLDWHLGSGVDNGEAVAKRLSNRLADPAFLPNLEAVLLHSLDGDKARAMANTLIEALKAAGRDGVSIIGHQW